MWIGKAAWKHMAVAMIASVLAVLGAVDAMAQDEKQELGIELNKVEDVAGACHGSFVIYNQIGRALERLTLDLYLFDPQNIISHHTVLDIGPIPKSKTRIVTFSMIQDKCETVKYMILNDIPNCVASGGELIDCTDLARVWSFSQTGLEQ